MPVVGPLLIGAGSIGSALIGSSAAKSASEAQSQAASNALAFQQQQMAKLNPWINVGSGANYTLGSLYGIGQDGSRGNTPQDFSSFTNSPDYQFALQQGQLGLDRYENARGMSMSGGALKDAAQFNQGLATQQFGNYFNRLLSLSQMGQNAAGTAVGGGNAAANTIMGQGQAQAAGIVGSANALTGGINSGITNSLLYNAINRSSYAPMNVGASSAGNLGGTGGNLGGWF
ncbi:MAG: hypothetical protein KGL39_30885 [Patescibacteria group bacterium]|nr:hypothetical protein [Patescibacteria group bacterium]